jgi:hypothetical protein
MQVAQIRKSCERLMHEKEMLVQYADALSARLGCFDELEALGTDFHKLAPNAGHADLIPLLNRLDECLTYMSSNPQYMDTLSYTLRLRQLQVRHVVPGLPCQGCGMVLRLQCWQSESGICQVGAWRAARPHGTRTSSHASAVSMHASCCRN